MTAVEELKQLLHLMELEKEEEIRQYKEILAQLPISERIKKGACWFPLQIEQLGWSLGDHPFVLIERTQQVQMAHKFRAGAVVSLFSEQSGQEQQRPELGVIHFVDRNKMKIILYGTEIPYWLQKGRIGVQLAFDERGHLEMVKAVKQVMQAEKNRTAELREILLGYKAAQWNEYYQITEQIHLNDSQNKAIENILGAVDVAIIHGPPGTGKTTTLVEAIKQIVKKESPVLVCAPSNTAVDFLTEKLHQAGVSVVRIGNLSRVDEDLLQHTVEGILEGRPEAKEIKKMKIEASQLYKQAERHYRTYGSSEREEKKSLKNEARSLIHHAKMLEDYVIEKILTEADVICCTLVSAMNKYIEKKTFKTVVIDEAAQALEPACWIAIGKAQRVIFAGDPFQLPPTVKSMQAQQGGYSKTLLEKMIERQPRVDLLKVQYRMNEKIMGFSNALFYQNELKAASFVSQWTIGTNEGYDSEPISFIDTAGCGYEESINTETKSYYNPDEYAILRMHLDRLLYYSSAVSGLQIGIISPYKEQVIYMQEQIKSDFDHFPDADITVDTIDSFQGQERDIIYISLVRSNDSGEIGFLKDSRRMNVAMTRAKKKLIIIGDSATLGAHPFYEKLLTYCEQCQGYKTAWEYV